LLAESEKTAQGRGIVFLSLEHTEAQAGVILDRIKRSYVADSRTLSPARMARLCDQVFEFDGSRLNPASLAPPAATPSPRFGFVVSNGFGLGHIFHEVF
jgi:hypothetical protein